MQHKSNSNKANGCASELLLLGPLRRLDYFTYGTTCIGQVHRRLPEKHSELLLSGSAQSPGQVLRSNFGSVVAPKFGFLNFKTLGSAIGDDLNWPFESTRIQIESNWIKTMELILCIDSCFHLFSHMMNYKPSRLGL